MAGPTSYIKDQENGFFFKPRDGKDLNQKIEDILSMNEHQIKEIKDHAYQNGQSVWCKWYFSKSSGYF